MNNANNDIKRLIDTGEYLFNQGWSPATSSNYSIRQSPSELLITASGKHKGRLSAADFLIVNLAGDPTQKWTPANEPSAETLLHCQLYEMHPEVQSVLHTHSIAATVLSRHLKDKDCVKLQGYELQKAFEGVHSHEDITTVPIVPNHQDMTSLSDAVKNALNTYPNSPAYLIRGHGLYTWASSLEITLRHIEALEFLLEIKSRTFAVEN